jgi:hypothetical protein
VASRRHTTAGRVDRGHHHAAGAGTPDSTDTLIGLPYHWGVNGLASGDSANDLFGIVLDANVHIQERRQRPATSARAEGLAVPPCSSWSSPTAPGPASGLRSLIVKRRSQDGDEYRPAWSRTASAVACRMSKECITSPSAVDGDLENSGGHSASP